MNQDTPLTCDMGVFTPTQREAHVRNTTELIQAVQSAQEVENGYEFIFPNETELISRAAEFISKERLCCPFLKFTLNILSNGEPVSLALTGPTGTQEFLRAEFNGAFQ
ncbi:MAG TPA: hypothetical protein VK249_30045 [Anaerolineales bacterium]|nr:hypothetical protein [Anaerolineales bacterium]